MYIPYNGFDELLELPVKVVENPIYSPRKHTVSTYRAQQRAAKKRKRCRK